MVVSGLRAACPSHLTLWRLSSRVMGICPVASSSSAVEGPPVPRYLPAHHAAHAGVAFEANLTHFDPDNNMFSIQTFNEVYSISFNENHIIEYI